MITISKHELNLGIYLSQRVANCKDAHTCLWLKRDKLSCPQGEKDCPAVNFRKEFEGDSPPYYEEALWFSKWWCVSRLTTIDISRKRDKEILEKKVHDVDIYGQLVALIVNPLSLAAQGIPLLESAEIKVLRQRWCLDEKNRTMQKMNKINPEWFGWIKSILGSLIDDRIYYDAVFYLAYLFLRGLELPDLLSMPEAEKARFFLEIERCLSV